MAPPSVPAKKKSLRAAALVVLPMLAGAALGVLGAIYFPGLLPDRRFSGAEMVATAVVLAALPVGVVAVHEAGHLLGGRLAGFRAVL
ncbi:MAG TPA: hypothetical protein VFQ76_18475, partial [Longimicrobiaceae bacterium]|nr:hypothetical protein [Longimicrobiaceae bacterium]